MTVQLTNKNPIVKVRVGGSMIGLMPLSTASETYDFDTDGLVEKLNTFGKGIEVETVTKLNYVTVEFERSCDFDFTVFQQYWSEMEDKLLRQINQVRNFYNSIIESSDIEYSSDDLLHSGAIQDVETYGVVVGWCHNGYDPGTSFYDADMLGEDWELHTTAKAQAFIDSRRKITNSKRLAKQAADKATYKRLKKQFEGTV